MRTVDPFGYVDKFSAFYDNIGVRPALYLDLSTVIIFSGNGTKQEPYNANPTITAEQPVFMNILGEQIQSFDRSLFLESIAIAKSKRRRQLLLRCIKEIS